jgi:hypothetical protein
MSAPLGTYAAEDTISSFLGQIMSGTADGTFVKASRNNDSFELTVGADGSPARAAQADKSGTVEITLLQTSLYNDFLSQVLVTDELTKVNTGPLLIKDLRGATLVSAQQAWVKKFADVTLAKGIEARTWTIETGRLNIFVAGNPL